MPKLPVDYSRIVIYKIEHIENPELVYVGSTTDFSKRKYQHKNNCNNTNKRI
jgi:predicted GIY-YIG superfamily endonuclease